MARIQEVLQEKDQKAQDEERLRELQAETERLRKELLATMAELGKVQQTERGLILTFSSILFSFNQYDLKPGAQQKLGQLAELLASYPERGILIEGHTDSVGNKEYNQKLSEKRAQSVRKFLAQQGMEKQKLIARGYGEGYPVANNNTPVGRQENRRVEVVILNPGQNPKAHLLEP